ncbi:hypothetical protein J6W91_01040 [Candidatus Saccharibacteria bacterium]|nr:hypothetical protein [Candidatus Saccharibacteria bacterium]
MQTKSFNLFKNEDTKIRNLSILAAIVFVILVIVVIIYFIIDASYPDDGIGEVPPNVYFSNRTDLNRAIDTYPAGDVLTHLEGVVLDESEISSAPSKNRSETSEYERYTVTVRDISKLVTEPDITYQATFSVSDDRVYDAIIREDSAWGSDYICTILTRTDNKTNWLFINTNDSLNEETCKTWGKEKNLNFKEIKTSALSVIER